MRLDRHHGGWILTSLAERAGLTRSAIPTAYPVLVDDDTMERFFSKIRLPPLARLVTACWIWQGSSTTYGYAKFHLGSGHPRGRPRKGQERHEIGGKAPRREVLAHRLMLALTTGVNGLEREADHTCSRGPDGCVSPFHLRWITWQENMAARDDAQGWTREEGELPDTHRPDEEIPI